MKRMRLQADRAEYKQWMAEVAEKAEADSNIAAIGAAVGALEKGMAGGFLQTGTAQVVRKLAIASESMLDGDRQELLSFFAGEQGTGYSPQSGDSTGQFFPFGLLVRYFMYGVCY